MRSAYFLKNTKVLRKHCKRDTLQYSCLENPHGQKSLEGYSPWSCKELDVTEWLSTAQQSYLNKSMLLYLTDNHVLVCILRSCLRYYVTVVGNAMENNGNIQSWITHGRISWDKYLEKIKTRKACLDANQCIIKLIVQ